MIKKPFLIRHAGSDVHKFHPDNEFREIIGFYFKNASVVVTNVTSTQLVENMMSDNLNNILCKSRYIPDPKTFKFSESTKTFDILFAGKVNYHWKHKGLLILFEVIKKRKLKALFVIGGKYVNEVLNLISSKGLKENIVVSSFVSPEEMPRIYGASKYVWCWEEKGTIDDFSNIIWEAIFCNVPCIINKETLRKPEMCQIMDIFPHLIHDMNQNDIFDFEFGSEATFGAEVNRL